MRATGKGGIFYGWIIVVAAFFAFGMVFGTVTYSYGVFVNPVAAAFHTTNTAVLFGFTLTNVGTGVLGVYAGRMLARLAVRTCMLIGLVGLAVGFLALSFVTSLWQFLAVYSIVISFGAALVAPLGAATIVTNWFTQARGRALTMATLGTSFGQLLLPRLAASCVEAWGWQGAYKMFAGVLLVVALPVILFIVVDHPEQMQLQPYGAEVASRENKTGVPPLLPVRQVLARSDFWAIATSYVLAVIVYLALVAVMVPYARTYGVSAIQASYMTVCMGIFAIMGKFAFATWTDRMGLRNTFWIALGLNLVGLVLLLTVTGYDVLYLVSACVGASAGGLLPLWPGFVAFRFGRHALAQVMGLMSPVIVILQGFGAPFATALHYKPAFLIFIMMLLASAVISRNLSRPLSE